MTSAAAAMTAVLLTAAPAQLDLSGYWSAGDGALVEVRQTGPEVWAVDDTTRFVFHGRLEGAAVRGSWIAMQTAPLATGTMTLEVVSADRLAMARTVGMESAGGRPWVRQPVPKGAVVVKGSSTYAGTFAEAACATVWCPAGGASGSVWGTEVYTGDSSICAAAAHSGLITVEQGGPAVVRAVPGQQAYQASTRNGVSSRQWGAYASSFTFAKQCDPGAALPGQALDKALSATGATTAAGLLNRKGTVWYSCPPDVVPATVWGTDVYTDDSSICGAAIHAGVLQVAQGGLAGLEAAGPAAALNGSSRNGVLTRPYGAWQRTFRVVKAGPAEKAP